MMGAQDNLAMAQMLRQGQLGGPQPVGGGMGGINGNMGNQIGMIQQMMGGAGGQGFDAAGYIQKLMSMFGGGAG